MAGRLRTSLGGTPRKVIRVSNRVSPYDAWQRLLEGNERFVSGDSMHPNQNASRRSELVNAQSPFAVIFGCADSRLAAEIIFDVGLGDVFVVRTAGHVIDDAVLGSLEYAVSALHVPLIVVLGHDNCGAVTHPRPGRTCQAARIHVRSPLRPARHRRAWMMAQAPSRAFRQRRVTGCE